MEPNNNIYGERFWEDVISTSEDFPDLAHTVEVSSSSAGEDILQQSLRQANILDANIESDPLDFDDFGFSFNNHSNSSNQPLHSNAVAPSSSLSSTSQTHKDDSLSFNVSEFLNIQTAPAQAITVSQTSAPVSTANVTVASYPVTCVHYHPSNSQLLLRTQTGNVAPVQVLASSTSMAPSNSGAFLLQLPKEGIAVNSASKFMLTPQSAQYIISGAQSKPPRLKLLESTQIPLTVQSCSAAVCRSTFTTTISHPISTPVVLTASSLNSQVIASPNAVQIHSRVQAPLKAQQKPAASSHDEQSTRLALILQNRAINLPGVGKVLKVSNQNVNISDFAVAKALASRILQQKLQQKQNSIAMLAPSPQTKTVSQNVTLINLPASNIKHAAVVSLSQQPHNQNSNLDVRISQVSVNPQVKNTPVQVLTSTNFAMINKPNQVLQVVKRENNSPSPQSRFQIASVNISRPSSQPNLSATTAQHRKSSPISNTSPPKLVNAVKVIPIRTSLNPSTMSGSSTVVQSAPIKLNLTTQQASSLTSEQLQKLVLQHQAAMNSKRTSVPVTTSNQPITRTNGAGIIQSTSVQLPQPLSLDNVAKVMTFRVDPNLTSHQIDEVQQIILKKVPLNKAQQLTNEQKQLLSAFRAQLRTMEPGIQQYYLRNPHLFLQKVFQHLQSGKPFLLQVKVDHLSNIKTATAPMSNAKPYDNNHPTITLSSAEGNRPQVTPAFTPVHRAPQVRSVPQPHPQPPSLQAPLRPPIPLQISTPQQAPASAIRHTTPVVTSTRKMKRSANIVPDNSAMQALPAKRPVLIMEQLQKHREMAATPNISLPFKSVRDAYRRLLPFHVYNMPQIKDTAFHESESMFDGISLAATTKISKMLRKYHLLCLKEAGVEDCSADAVMLDRIFLQHEKAQLVETKQTLKDSPSSLASFLPSSYASSYPALAKYFEGRTRTEHNQPQSRTHLSPHHNSQSAPSLTEDKKPDDILLQEAVDSILT